MKDRDLHTRDADEILWSDGKRFSEVMREPVEPEEFPETDELSKWEMAVSCLVLLVSAVVIAAFLFSACSALWQVFGGRE